MHLPGHEQQAPAPGNGAAFLLFINPGPSSGLSKGLVFVKLYKPYKPDKLCITPINPANPIKPYKAL